MKIDKTENRHRHHHHHNNDDDDDSNNNDDDNNNNNDDDDDNNNNDDDDDDDDNYNNTTKVLSDHTNQTITLRYFLFFSLRDRSGSKTTSVASAMLHVLIVHNGSS